MATERANLSFPPFANFEQSLKRRRERDIVDETAGLARDGQRTSNGVGILNWTCWFSFLFLFVTWCVMAKGFLWKRREGRR